MRIGIDLDGVIVDSVPRWIDILNCHAGTNYGPDELPDTHGTPEMAAHSNRHELEMAIVAGPVEGATAALHHLRAGGHSLVVITARTPRLRRMTEAWLDYHSMAFDRLHFLEGASKAPVAVAEGIDLMIEDAPHNAIALAQAGVAVLLFGAPYNRDVSHPLIQRCAGWEAVLAEVGVRTQRGATA